MSLFMHIECGHPELCLQAFREWSPDYKIVPGSMNKKDIGSVTATIPCSERTGPRVKRQCTACKYQVL